MELPQPSSKDDFLKIAKGLLGMLPIGGGLVAELFELVIVPAQQKKMEEWFGFVNTTLDELQTKGVLTKESLFNDEEFISVLQKTSRSYLGNIEKNKIPIYQGYLKAVITKPLPLDKKYIYLHIIDTLTESQLMVFKEIFENENSGNYLFQSELLKKLIEKYAEGDDAYFKLLEKGLQDFHLINYQSAEIVIGDENQWHMRTSKIGKDFLGYVLTA